MIDKFYWSPSAVWYIDDDNILTINGSTYDSEIAKLFPKFYYLTVQGSLTTQLLYQYKEHDANMVRNFIKTLLREKVLVYSIDDVTMLFNAQSRMFKQYNTFTDEVKTNPNAKKEFTESALNRDIVVTQSPIALQDVPVEDTFVLNRKSVRTFDKETLVSYTQLSGLLSILRERIVDGVKKYNFASGGGLYPIDYYIHVKDNRVEGLPQGVYIYVPRLNELRMVSIPEEDFKEAHYFGNQDIYNSSAFSMYLVYNAKYSMPKYDGLGYYLGIVDSGIVSQALSISAERNSLGSCIIGEMNFDRISKYFNLDVNQKYLHCIEFGLKSKEEVQND